MKKRIVITYCQITPESAEQGDFSETGFINKKGVEVDDVEDAVDFLKREGVSEASSSTFHPDIWYSTDFSILDYRDGSEEQTSFHLKGFTKEEQKEVYQALFGNKRRKK